MSRYDDLRAMREARFADQPAPRNPVIRNKGSRPAKARWPCTAERMRDRERRAAKSRTPVTAFKVDKLLIEAKASGIPPAQELRNRYASRPWAIQQCQVKGDKLARALAVQPIFSQGTVYTPDREWADLVITEMSLFPAGRFSDLTDSTSQGLKYLRDVGLAQSEEEQHEAETETVRRRPWRRRPLYPC